MTSGESLQIPIKRADGFSLPVLGLGTWQMGGGDRPGSGHDDERDIAAIKQAVEAGITHIDTAEIYSDGRAEELVGRAVKGNDRGSLFITSKVAPYHLRKDEVIGACRRSLKRLGLNYLDLYLIHGPNPEVPLKDTFAGLEALLEEGLIRHMGVSNFDVPWLEEALLSAKHPIANNQIHYNLGARAYEDNGTLAFCRQHQILVTAWRPIWKGEVLEPGLEILRRLADKYGKTPVQVALNWIFQKPGMVTLVKTSNPSHLAENLAALGWRLTAEDEALLDREFPRAQTKYVGRRPR